MQLAVWVLAARWLLKQPSTLATSGRLLAAGVVGLLVGLILDRTFMPINKNLWTPSYCVFMTGWSLVAFAFFHAVMDARTFGRTVLKPLTIYGMNALFIFAFSGFVARLLVMGDTKRQLYAPIQALPISAENASLVFAVLFNIAMFAVAWLMWKKKMVRAGMTKAWLFSLAVMLTACAVPEQKPQMVPAPVPTPSPAPTAAQPTAPKEFRAAWVASVGNIDWPSRRDLTVAQQKAELIAIVDRAKDIGLNALIVQVRPAADALYPSTLEPWSEYLTGRQGKAPEPFYDPLAMWIAEGHRRGIEIHAWFNPYRARHSTARSAMAPNHAANTLPRAVKAYGDNTLWLDPGEAAAARRTLEVITDVTRRYDVDGIHIDDYFYPYPEKGADGREIDFPDDVSWVAYTLSGGPLARPDWRRANVDSLVQRIDEAVHREKPWVKFGVSPFGVGRPGLRPAGVEGFSQYDGIYANVELWMERGWLDYLAPQLYWPTDSPGQPFGVLLDYWTRANPMGRHVWPGYFTSRIDAPTNSWSVDEIARQVALTRNRGVDGHIHFSMAAIMQNRQGIADRLKALYAVPARVPETSWLAPRR